MRPSVLAVVASLFGAGLCLVGPSSEMCRSEGQPLAKRAVAEEKQGPGKLEGSWELVACDYGHTIGYQPELKVSPGYAMLMYAFAATNPKGAFAKHALRWRFAEKRLIVETVSAKDAKEVREKVAAFDCVLQTQRQPMLLDLTFQPRGFDGMCRDEKGQKVLGIIRANDKLEVALAFSGKKRPTAFRPNKFCYRLVFRRVKQ